MGNRQMFLLLLVLCVFASFVSASSVTFLDEWGEPAARVLENAKALVRVVDPAADTSPGRDSVTVDLSSQMYMDSGFADLMETGDSTGVFEGAANLTTDYQLNYLEDEEHLLTRPWYSVQQGLDTATATYGAATATAEVAPSVTDLIDDAGFSPAFLGLGEPVRVRVRESYADRSAGPDVTTAVLSTSGGDSEPVVLIETGAYTRVFEASLPSGTGAPVIGDGRLQTAAGETVTVVHGDVNGFTSSSDTAGVAGASVRFLRPRDGRSTTLYPVDSAIAVRVTDLSRNLDPAAIESLGVPISLLIGQDSEVMTLRETGPDTGVFEGSIQQVSSTYWSAANGLLESSAVLPQFDSVRVEHDFIYAAEAVLTGSITRLVDEAGTEAESFALGTDLRVEVETALYSGSVLDVKTAEVRSLTTGDLETLRVLETDGRSNLYKGALAIVPGAAVPGDGRLQAQPGETVEVEHEDANGVTSSGDQAAVVRSAVRFVDELGLPVTVLLEESTARVRVLDLLSAGQPPATIRSRITGDVEPLDLAGLPASPGLFEGSIPMARYAWESGILTTGRQYLDRIEPDTITAGDGQAAASLLMVPATVEVLNGSASAGDTLSVRVTAPRADTSPGVDYFGLIARAWETDDLLYVGVMETGGSTGIFEGTLETVLAGGYPSDTALDVEAADTVRIFYYASEYANDPTALVVGVATIVPVAVELLDGQGEPVESYLLGDVIHVRVAEPGANTDPGTVETVTATVSSRRYGDAKLDVETVTLTETGPDTGELTGTLPTGVRFYDSPVPGDGLLEFPDYFPAPDNDSTVTATRSGVTATARVRDSKIWLTDALGEDAASFDVGSTIQVWMRRPRGNTTPGADVESVGVEVRAGTVYRDSMLLALTETGGDTGLFTATVPTAPPPVDFLDAVVQAVPGDLLFAQRSNYILYSFDTAVFTGESGGEPPNRNPDAVDDSAATGEDTPVVINVRANDSDPDGDPIEVFEVWPASHGTAVLNPDGTVTYTPPAGYNGTDLFMYAVRDGAEGTPYLTDTATVFVTVNPVNDPPNATNDSATTNEDTPVNVAVKANDGDPEGDPIAVVSATPGANGSTAAEADGTVTYTPDSNFFGTDTFTYTLSDGSSTDTATVTVTVLAANDPPVAVDDSATTNEDSPVNFPVLANDSDPDGDTLSVVSVTQGSKGSVVINQSPGAFHYLVYTPNSGATGGDSFTYLLSDGQGGGAFGTVTMTITPVNDPPKAFDDSVTTAEDTPLTFDPRTNDTDPDGDPLTVTSASDPNRGSTVVNPDGTITYTPEPNLSGIDLFVYSISDGQGGTWAALVTVTVTPVNDVPDASNDLVSTNEDTPLTVQVLSNDVDIDGNTLTVTALTQPTDGTAVLNADKTITYTPNPNFTGSDSFTYSISDGNGGTDTATVSVSVLPVNDPPVAVADSATVAEEGTVIIPVAANDTDPENSTLTLTAVTQGAHGTVTILTGNQVRYQPAVNYAGPDTFTYTIRDPGNLTSTGTVTVTVTPVNDPPVANDDSITLQEDSGIAFQPMANDTDVDGDTLTIVAVTQSANGSVGISGTWVSFAPAANFHGGTSFTYTIRDAGGVERTAYVNVSVTSVNDPPLAGPDTAATNEDVPVTVSVLANDADVDGGALSVSAVTQGSNGTVTTNGVTVTYTPAANFNGSDSFTYNVSDGTGGGGGTATGLVTVSVATVNDGPVANPDSGSTREGVAVIIPVLANDTDLEGNALTVTAVGAPGVLLPDNTVQYTPGANFTGTVTFSYTVSDGQGGTANGQVTVVVGEALERVAILATNSAWLRSGSDVLSGDVIVNQASAGPYLNGAELSVGGSVTTPANWDVEADSLTVAAGAVIGGDVSYNQLTNGGTINGLQRSPLALPVFPVLPAFLTATPGSTNVNVSTNGTRTLAPGSYLDLVVGRKGTVTFTGGVYHFRSITVDREAKLLFSAASEVRVQQKLSTKNLTTVGPAAGASIDASSILFYVAGINGTTGALTATPKAVEIGTNNTVSINLYAPNGTTWLQDGSLATGALLGKDIDVGLNVQVTLDSAY